MSRRSTTSTEDFDQASPQSWLSSFLGREFASRGQVNLKRFFRGIAFAASMFVLSPGALLALQETDAAGTTTHQYAHFGDRDRSFRSIVTGDC